MNDTHVIRHESGAYYTRLGHAGPHVALARATTYRDADMATRCAAILSTAGRGSYEPVAIADLTPLHPSVRDVAWIDDNDGFSPRKLSASVRCF